MTDSEAKRAACGTEIIDKSALELFELRIQNLIRGIRERQLFTPPTQNQSSAQPDERDNQPTSKPEE